MINKEKVVEIVKDISHDTCAEFYSDNTLDFNALRHYVYEAMDIKATDQEIEEAYRLCKEIDNAEIEKPGCSNFSHIIYAYEYL